MDSDVIKAELRRLAYRFKAAGVAASWSGAASPRECDDIRAEYAEAKMELLSYIDFVAECLSALGKEVLS